MKTKKTTKAEFEKFKSTFLDYAKLFGLTGYTFYFEHCENMREECATFKGDALSGIGVVALAVNMPREHLPTVESLAKHEAIHALLCDFAYEAEARYTNPDRIAQAEESIVTTLAKIIPDP